MVMCKRYVNVSGWMYRGGCGQWQRRLARFYAYVGGRQPGVSDMMADGAISSYLDHSHVYGV